MRKGEIYCNGDMIFTVINVLDNGDVWIKDNLTGAEMYRTLRSFIQVVK